MKTSIVLALLLCNFSSFAQPNLSKSTADSLWEVWSNPQQADTNRLLAMHMYTWNGYLFTKPDSAFYYAGLQYEFAKSKGLKIQMAAALNTQGVSCAFRSDYPKAIEYFTKSLKIKEEIGNKEGIATALNNIGIIYYDQSDYANALDYYTRSLKIRKEIGDKNGIAASYNNIGVVYSDQGDYANAIAVYTKGLKIREELGDKKGISSIFNNIGLIHDSQGEYDKAISYLSKSLKIDEELGDKKAISGTLNNIGLIYYSKGDYTNALSYQTRSLEIVEDIGDKKGIATALINIGSIYKQLGDLDKAVDYFNRCLKISEAIGDKQGITLSLINISSVYQLQNEYEKAKEYSKKALYIAQEIGNVLAIQNAAKSLWEVNKELGKYEASLNMLELFIEMRDSILSEENQNEIMRQAFKYKYEKKAATDSVANAKANEVRDAQIAQQAAELKVKRNQQFALYGGLLMALLFFGLVFNRLKVTQKQKNIIEVKEKETLQQKEIIEQKHKEITDSINYAERIQRSFLASNEILDRSLENHFVFFQPKDVVSGDFYWAKKLPNGNFALCCADSTGHGVPGAIMSILNIYSLEKAIEQHQTPADILNEARTTIIERLKKDGSTGGGKDGMDCSLLIFDPKMSQLTYAAANNSLWLVRKGELSEYKGDNMPVGKHHKDDLSFSETQIDIFKGDMIYLLTDGMPDQFGGPVGKKYKYKQLRELMLSVAHLPMLEQKEIIADGFNKWKGDLEQVDDVTIMGIRI